MEKKKIARPRNWLYEFLVILEGLLLIGIWCLFTDSLWDAITGGILTYFALAWILRLSLQRHHRRGVALMRHNQYEQASAAFQASYDFFTKYSWIDQYRFITMFYSNAIPFRLMALNNLGICYLHMGEDKKALETFSKLAELDSNCLNVSKTVEAIQKHIEETEHS